MEEVSVVFYVVCVCVCVPEVVRVTGNVRRDLRLCYFDFTLYGINCLTGLRSKTYIGFLLIEHPVFQWRPLNCMTRYYRV